MSKKSSSKTWTEVCAFWAMVISGFAYLFGGILNFIISLIKSLNGTEFARIISYIYHTATFLGNIALIIAIAIPAWQFVKYKAVGWKVVYWIALIGFALGAVLGLVGSLGLITW